METAKIVVQACRCVALPVELAAGLGMLPGAVIEVQADSSRDVVTLRLLVAAAEGNSPPPTACSVQP